MDSTVRYLGVELEDALVIAEGIEIQIRQACSSDYRCNLEERRRYLGMTQVKR